MQRKNGLETLDIQSPRVAAFVGIFQHGTR